MAVETEPAFPAIELEEAEAPSLGFWNWWAALALEVALFAAGLVFLGIGQAVAIALAGLFLCAIISFIALQRSNSPLGIACKRLARKNGCRSSVRCRGWRNRASGGCIR